MKKFQVVRSFPYAPKSPTLQDSLHPSRESASRHSYLPTKQTRTPWKTTPNTLAKYVGNLALPSRRSNPGTFHVDAATPCARVNDSSTWERQPSRRDGDESEWASLSGYYTAAGTTESPVTLCPECLCRGAVLAYARSNITAGYIWM